MSRFQVTSKVWRSSAFQCFPRCQSGRLGPDVSPKVPALPQSPTVLSCGCANSRVSQLGGVHSFVLQLLGCDRARLDSVTSNPFCCRRRAAPSRTNTTTAAKIDTPGLRLKPFITLPGGRLFPARWDESTNSKVPLYRLVKDSAPERSFQSMGPGL